MALLGTIAAASTGSSCTTAAFDSRGSRLLIALLSSLDAVPAISDNQGNTWTVNAGLEASAGFTHHFAYCIDPVTSATHTVTAGDSTFPSLLVGYFDDVTLSYQGQSTGTGEADGSTPISCGSFTPSVSGLSIAGLLHYRQGAASVSDLTIDNSYTLGQNVASISDTKIGVAFAYRDVPASAITPSWSWNSSDDPITQMAAQQYVFETQGQGLPPSDPPSWCIVFGDRP